MTRQKSTYSHRHVQTRKRKRTNGRHPAIVYQHEGKPLVCRALTKRCRERYDTEPAFLRDLERPTALVDRPASDPMRLVKDRFFDRFRLVLGRKPASGI